MDLVVDVAAHSIEEGGVIGVVDEKDEVVVVISLPFERNGDFGGDWEACSLESVLSFFTKWFTFAIFDSGTFCFDAVFEVSILNELPCDEERGRRLPGAGVGQKQEFEHCKLLSKWNRI